MGSRGSQFVTNIHMGWNVRMKMKENNEIVRIRMAMIAMKNNISMWMNDDVCIQVLK